jgi:hypothetical protein
MHIYCWGWWKYLWILSNLSYWHSRGGGGGNKLVSSQWGHWVGKCIKQTHEGKCVVDKRDSWL